MDGYGREENACGEGRNQEFKVFQRFDSSVILLLPLLLHLTPPPPLPHSSYDAVLPPPPSCEHDARQPYGGNTFRGKGKKELNRKSLSRAAL
jgi:hypothetical protein